MLGVGAASLLPKQDRPAVLWTIDLDAEGAVTSTSVVRAIVRSRDQLTYEQVQRDVDRGTAADTLVLLGEVGEVRRRQEVARGGVSLDLPAQRVESDNGGYRIEFETTVPAMAWNAQISLLAGMVAAERMVTAGVGLLRTMPPPEGYVVDRVRRTARALHVAWPDGESYADVVRDLRSDVPDQAALLMSMPPPDRRSWTRPRCCRWPPVDCEVPATSPCRWTATATASGWNMPRWQRSTPMSPHRCGASGIVTSPRPVWPSKPETARRPG